MPVARVKISLFMLTAASAALLAALQVLNTGSADVLRGEQKELEAVAAAVIGGNLLTGGYGSVLECCGSTDSRDGSARHLLYRDQHGLV